MATRIKSVPKRTPSRFPVPPTMIAVKKTNVSWENQRQSGRAVDQASVPLGEGRRDHRYHQHDHRLVVAAELSQPDRSNDQREDPSGQRTGDEREREREVSPEQVLLKAPERGIGT